MATCSAHEDMLHSRTFWSTMGIAVTILLAAICAVWGGSASKDRVAAVEKRQDRQQVLLDRIDDNVIKLLTRARNDRDDR